MKKWILVVIVVCSLVGISSSEAIIKTAGMASQCDTANAGCFSVPLQASVLCGPAASCPNVAMPSLTNANRFWGGTGSSCRTSSDGGTTWANCTTQPLSSGSRENYAGTSDGSVIAIGQVGATCTIKRSIDNAANWTTVFTNAVLGCNANGNSGSTVQCLSDGQCDFVFTDGAGLPRVLHSDDDGQNWTLTTNGAVATSTFTTLAWDGINGVVTSNGSRGEKYSSGLWTQGGGAIAGCDSISGAVVWNSVGYQLCNTNGTGEGFQLRNTDGTLITSITLPGANQTGANPIYMVALNGSTLYAVTNVVPSPVQLPLGIWLSRDAGVSFTKIFTSSSGVNSINTISNMFTANGCIYFSGGSSAMFVKVC
jgi:hypothetical protein